MSDTLDLLSWQPLGKTIVPERDTKRLGAQMQRVIAYVSDEHWHTLREIAEAIGAPEASVSARLRDCRRLGFQVDREFVCRGLHRYRAIRA